VRSGIRARDALCQGPKAARSIASTSSTKKVQCDSHAGGRRGTHPLRPTRAYPLAGQWKLSQFKLRVAMFPRPVSPFPRVPRAARSPRFRGQCSLRSCGLVHQEARYAAGLALPQAAEVNPSAFKERQVGVCRRQSVNKLPTDQSPTPNWRCPMAARGQEVYLWKEKGTPSSPASAHPFWRASSNDAFCAHPARQNHFPAHAIFMKGKPFGQITIQLRPHI